MPFPGIADFRKRTIRTPENPLDKCTIVSIYPREIDEIKHTIQPGRFILPAGSYENPAVLVVGSSSWWKDIDENQPLLEIPNSSIQVADSVVKDYCSGILECNMADIMPGIFYIPGSHTTIDIKTKHKVQLDKARDNQLRWYKRLIFVADYLWANSQGNPLAISDDMRLAAKELGQNTKEWLQDFQLTETVRCVACGHLRNPLFPVCPNCKSIIDTGKAKELGIRTAQ